MEVLFPLIRFLHISSDGIFYPEDAHDTSNKVDLQRLVAGCSEQEAILLLSIFQGAIDMLHSAQIPKKIQEIKLYKNPHSISKMEKECGFCVRRLTRKTIFRKLFDNFDFIVYNTYFYLSSTGSTVSWKI